MDTNLLLNELQSKAHFPDADFPAFLALFEQLTLKKKDHLYRSGQIIKHVSFIIRGCVRHYYANEAGVERIVMIGEENWWIGDIINFLERKPTNLNLQAIEQSDLLVINRDNFDRALKEFPGFLEYYKITTQRTYTRLQEQVGQSLSDSAETKYRRLLKECPSLAQRVPQHHIAEYLGITPESLSRVRKKIAEK